MKKQNPRSEAAIKRWLKFPQADREVSYFGGFIRLYGAHPRKGVLLVAEVDPKDFIKKRQPLTGIKKQMSAIVSGKKKVKK